VPTVRAPGTAASRDAFDLLSPGEGLPIALKRTLTGSNRQVHAAPFPEEISMHPNHPTPENARTDRRPAQAEPPATIPATSPTAPLRPRHWEKTGGWTRRERLRILWYRLRLTVQEMNYATLRMVEVQMDLPGQPPPALARRRHTAGQED
jgi:hypothetical protein